jgi:hypothetical protein
MLQQMLVILGYISNYSPTSMWRNIPRTFGFGAVCSVGLGSPRDFTMTPPSSGSTAAALDFTSTPCVDSERAVWNPELGRTWLLKAGTLATAAFAFFWLTVPGDCTAFVVWETGEEDTAGVLDGRGTAAFAFFWLTVTGGDFIVWETTEEDTADALDGHGTVALLGGVPWRTILPQQHSK